MDLSDAVVAKDGNVFVVARPDGSLPGGEGWGVWMDDCRYLDTHLITGGSARVHRRPRADGSMDEELQAAEPVELEIGADFAPMLAVRGILPLPGRERVQVQRRPDGVRMSARCADGVTRATTITTDPAPEWLDGGRLRLPAGRTLLRYRFEPAPAQPADAAAPFAHVTCDDERFARLIERSLLDLRMLRSHMDGEEYFAAGLPWYATLFGRDSLITALQMLAWAPTVAERTLRLLASRLGERDDPVNEEEPGKVLHELRVGEAARPGATPLARYYGTVDATPLWLCLLAEHADWTDDLSLFEDLRPAVEATLAWIDRPGDRLLEYAARAPGGLRNQGWKDSEDGIVDEHGAPLEPPIALLEAQAYAIRARRGAARLFERAGDRARAAALEQSAQELAGRLESRLWLPDRGFYAMAVDAGGRPSRALASNQGHLLWATPLPGERARAVRDALMGERLFSGWGIRTLAEGEAAYDPLGYHLGTVWPHDTALAAAGLRRHGFAEDFQRLLDALVDAAAAMSDDRLPELFGGNRRTSAAPAPYPVACRPQAWAAGTLPFLLIQALGLRVDEGRLHVAHPLLPRDVRRLELRDLRVAGATVDLEFERGPDAAVRLARRRVQGPLQIVT